MQIPCKAMGLAAALVLTASMAVAQSLNGPNFAIQTYATGPQGAADAAIDSGGHFIVTWAEHRSRQQLHRDRRPALPLEWCAGAPSSR